MARENRIWADPYKGAPLNYWALASTPIRMAVQAPNGKVCEVGSASGFFFGFLGETFLVTNRHVVIDEDSDFYPDFLELRIHEKQNPLDPGRPVKVALYSEAGKPRWKEHPEHGARVDVTAIEATSVLDYSDGWPYRWDPHDVCGPEELLQVGRPLAVLGYPRGLRDRTHNFPLAKTATVASLHGFPFADEPCFLVDGNLQLGNSGSPVVNPFGREFLPHLVGAAAGGPGGGLGDDDVQKRASDTRAMPTLVGVYSGAMVKDDSEFGLHKVWYAHLVREILGWSAENLGRAMAEWGRENSA